MITEKCNPVAARAELRRKQWEENRPGFWTRKRLDAIDLILLAIGVAGVSVLMTIVVFH